MTEFPVDEHEQAPSFNLDALANWLAAHHPEVDFEPTDWDGEDEDDVLGNLLALAEEYGIEFMDLAIAIGFDVESAAFLDESTYGAQGVK